LAVIVGASRRWTAEDEDPQRGSSISPRAAGVFARFVAGTFVFGWSAGLLLVVKAWHVSSASRWTMISGAGYVTLMLVPILCGFCCTRVASQLARRGWGGAPLRVLALGVCGLVAGLMAV
jgi:hypothetical protein